MDKEVKHAKEHVRDKQTAYWGSVAAAGNTTAAKPVESQTAAAAQDAKPDERASSRARMTQ